MIYMLDTNICSYIIRNRPLEVLTKFQMLPADACCISSITYAELKYWVAKNKRLHEKSGNPGTPKINAQVIDYFVSMLEIVYFNAHAAEIYSEARAWMEEHGHIVGNADLMIGAHAVSLNLTLITNNTKDFKYIPKLILENWVNG